MLENKLFEALLDVIPFKAYAVDVNTFEVVYANKMMRENMYAPQETYCWEKVFGQEQICSWCSIMDLQHKINAIPKKEKVIIEFFDETDDKWLKSYDELMSWPDGRKVKYSILVDITDQKEIQGSMVKSHATLAMKNKQMSETNKKLQITKLKLQQSVNEFEQLLNSTMEGIMIFENAVCKDINRQALNLFDNTNKDFYIGKNILELVCDEYKEIIKDNSDLYGTAIECKLIKPNGTTFTALIQHTNLLSRGLVVTSFIDITEIKEKDKVIQEQNKMLALGEMMGNIAHHWRQPLNVISTSASGMRLEKEIGTLSDDSFNVYVDSIMDNTESLSETINIFSDFVKQKNESIVIVLEDIVDKIINMLSTSIHNNNIKIINNINNNDVTTLEIAIDDLSQIIINVVNNAIDVLTRNKIDDAWITFDIEKTEDKVILSIEDNGGGVPNDIKNRIFEPYFTTKHKSQGIGLSLNTCQKIMMEKLNGNINFKNTKNGAKFSLEFLYT